MTFLFMPALWLFLAVPPLVAAYIFVARRREKNAFRFLPLMTGGRPGRAGWRRHLPPFFFLLGRFVPTPARAPPPPPPPPGAQARPRPRGNVCWGKPPRPIFSS